AGAPSSAGGASASGPAAADSPAGYDREPYPLLPSSPDCAAGLSERGGPVVAGSSSSERTTTAIARVRRRSKPTQPACTTAVLNVAPSSFVYSSIRYVPVTRRESPLR